MHLCVLARNFSRLVRLPIMLRLIKIVIRNGRDLCINKRLGIFLMHRRTVHLDLLLCLIIRVIDQIFVRGREHICFEDY